MSEYILNNNPDKELSFIEKALLNDLEELSKKLSENNIPCFLCAKFENREDPVAAWYFGKDENVAMKTFSTEIAPLLLYVTSQMTGTNIIATNPNNNSTVYSINAQNAE